jgi:hypothetical protein
LSPYITQVRIVLKGLNTKIKPQLHSVKHIIIIIIIFLVYSFMMAT